MNAIEEVTYRDYILKVQPVASGWRVEIYPPGDSAAETPVPSTREFEAREACIAEAEVIVDKLLDV